MRVRVRVWEHNAVASLFLSHSLLIFVSVCVHVFYFVLFCFARFNLIAAHISIQKKKNVEIEPFCKRCSSHIRILLVYKSPNFPNTWYAFYCFIFPFFFLLRFTMDSLLFVGSVREKKIEEPCESMNEMIHFDECYERTYFVLYWSWPAADVDNHDIGYYEIFA